MDRWSGVLKIQLDPDSNDFFRVAASLCLSSSSKRLVVPSGNAIFFTGDRMEGTGNPVIERLSDPQNIAEVLVAKYGTSINAFVVDAPAFNGSSAVYNDFIPSLNINGEPRCYDATGFPASISLLLLLSKFLAEVRNIIFGEQNSEPYQPGSSTSVSHKPRTALLGFSKGGIVLNQLLTEFSSSEIPYQDNENANNILSEDEMIIPTSIDSFFNSLTEVHYVDVGLNTKGAYLTDRDVIDGISERISKRALGIRFLLHGTPRQWCDDKRIWIRKEKDGLVSLLKGVARRNMGKVKIRERLYFPGKVPDLQMHFEIIDVMDVNN